MATRKSKDIAPIDVAQLSHRRLKRILLSDILKGGIGKLGAEYTEKYTEHYSEQYSEHYSEQYTDAAKVIRGGMLIR